MYATGGLKKFFRLMAMLLAVASVVGLLPLSAIAEGFNTDKSAVETNDKAPDATPDEETRAGETTTELLNENFDSMSSIAASYSSTGWYAYNAGSGNNWALNSSSSYANSGSNSAQVQYSSSYAANCYLVSAPFTVSSGMTNLTVSLYERVRSSSYAETFDVFFVKASDVTTLAGVASATKYTAIASASYTNTAYAQQTGSVNDSALAGESVRAVVHCSSAADKYYLYIDDITVTETAADSPATTYTVAFSVNGAADTALEQTNLADGASVTLPTPSVDLTNYEQEYFIGWVTTDYPTATAISNIDPIYYVNSNAAYYTTPFTVDATMADANDTITLYALFGNWDGTSTTTVSSGGAVTNELLNENFDNNFALTSDSYSANGWYTYNAGSANNWQSVSTVTTSSSTYNFYNSASYGMYVPYSEDYAMDCYLVSEPFTVDSNMTSLDVSIYATSFGEWSEKFSVSFVKQSDINTSAGSFNASSLQQAISTTTLSTSLTFAEYTGSCTAAALKGETVRLVVHGESDADMAYLIIDDIVVSQTYTSNGTVPAYTDCTTVLTNPPAVTYTVNYYVNGSLLSSQTNVTTATLPTEAQAIANIDFDDYEEDAFVVWVPQTYAKGSLENLAGVTYYEAGSSLTAAQLGALADANDVVNLYALFAEEGEGGAPDYTFESVTTSQSYDFVIAAKLGDNYYPIPQQSSTSSGRITSTTPITVQTSGSTVYVAAADAVGYTWTISSPATNAYRIKSGSYYIYGASSTSLAVNTGTTYYWTKGTATNGSYRLVSTYATTRGLVYRYDPTETTYAFGHYAFTNVTNYPTEYYDLEILPIATGSGSAYEDYTYTTTLTPLAATHTVTINFAYTDGTTAPSPVVLNVREGEAYSYTVEVPTGYTSNYATISGTMGTENVTYNVTFTPVTYHINYIIKDSNGSTVDSHTDEVAYNAAVTVWQSTYAIEGYTLGNYTWHVGSENGSTTTAPTNMPANDLYAVAQFTINSYTVTYMVDGSQYATSSVQYGTNYIAYAPTTDPAKDGYTFTGWVYYAEGTSTEYTGEYMPAYNLTAVAQWRAVATAVSLVIDPNVVEINGAATATATVTVGQGAVLGTDYFISWAIISGSEYAEITTAETANQTTIGLVGIAQGVATVQVTVTNGRDNPITATATLTVGRYVTGIAVTHLPDTVAYATGESFDSTGMVVQYVYSDGTYGAELASSQYTVTAPNMNTASNNAVVTVTAAENSSWTDTFQINVHTASGETTTDIWVPVDAPVDGEEFLIGYKSGNNVYLLMNYNWDADSDDGNMYYNYTTDDVYVSYGIQAVMDGENVIGVNAASGSSNSIDEVRWMFIQNGTSGRWTIRTPFYSSFTSSSTGTSTDYYQYLRTYGSSGYSDLYNTLVTSADSTTYASWVWDSTNSRLYYRYSSSVYKYVTYYSALGSYSNIFYAPSTATTTSTLQLYGKQTVDTTHTVVFYGPDGKTIVGQITVENGGYITAAQLTAAQTAAMNGQTATFNGWDYYGSLGEGTFSNEQIAAYPVEEDCYFVANIGDPVYFVNFYEEDGESLINNISVTQGDAITAAMLAEINPPAVLGKQFVGWKLNGEGSVITTEAIEGHIPTGDESYVAAYELIDYTLTVHFVDGDNAGLVLPEDLRLTYNYGDTYMVPGVAVVTDSETQYPQTIYLEITRTRDGEEETVMVPYDADPQAVTGTMPASGLTVNVTYSIRKLNVTLVYGGVEYTQQVAYLGHPSQATFEAQCTLPGQFDPNQSNWYENSGLTGTYHSYTSLFDSYNMDTEVTSDVTYYLSVHYNSVTATFYWVAANPTVTDGKFVYSENAQESVEYGSKPQTEPTVPNVTYNGVTYEFIGWIISTDGSTYDTAHVYQFTDLPALTGNTYYRAVYYNVDQADTSRVYVLVEEPVDGQDYIIVDTRNGEDQAVTNEIVDEYYLVPVGVTLDFSEGGVEDYYCYLTGGTDENTVLWHFEADGDNWKITSQDGKTMTVTANDGHLTALASDSSNARWQYDDANHRLVLTSPTQTAKYLTFVGSSGSRLAKYIGFNDSELVMNNIGVAQNGTAANNSGRLEPAGLKAADEPTRATTVWAETTTITANQDYLIGIVYNNNVYLILGYYNGSSWYYSSGSNYIGYTALATIDSNGYVTGCSGNATNLDYCKWQFSTTSGGTIRSTQSSRYLYCSTSSTYSDLYPYTSSSTWTYQSSNNRLYCSAASKYLGYTTVSSVPYTSGTTSSSSAATIKLYTQTEVATGYTCTINYNVNGTNYPVTTTNVTSFTLAELADVASVNFSGYEQTDFIGWYYGGSYAVSDTAPSSSSMYYPGASYTISSNSTYTFYAMFAKDNTGSGITTIDSNHNAYKMETSTSTALYDSASWWIFIMDAVQNKSLYATTGSVYSDSAYTTSDIITDIYGNKYISVATSDYKYCWHHTTSNTLTVQDTATGTTASAYSIYYSGSSSPYPLAMSQSSAITWTMAYSDTDSYGTRYSIYEADSNGNFYMYYNSGSYYQSTAQSSASKYYVFSYDNASIIVTDASRFSTTLTTAAATTYTITVNQPTGGTIGASTLSAAAGTTITLTATPATGYTFGSWTVTNTSTGAAVTVTNNSFTMPAGNVTVTATFTQGGVQPGTVYYLPTSTIVVGEEYLIGYKDGSGNVYLMMNYNPNRIGTSYRYYSNSSNYYAYGIKAVMSGNNVVGVDNSTYASATINNAEWIFERGEGAYYRIQSAYTADNGAYYLRVYQSEAFSDLYAANSDIDYYGHQWQWDSVNNRLSFYYNYNGTTFTKYVTYTATVGSYSNFFHAPSTAASVQLYRKMTGTAGERRFTLTEGSTQYPAGEIKLYGIKESSHVPEVRVTPGSKTLYWYDENVVEYGDAAEIIQSAVLTGSYSNIAASDVASVNWTSSDPSVVSISPDGNNCTVNAEAIGTAVITYSITDIFGNVYSAEALIVVQQAPLGEIPEEDETWYTGGPEYKVYIETDHFEAGKKYIIARDYTTSSTSTSITSATYERVTSLSSGNTYVFVYGDSSTLANCTVLKAVSSDGITTGSGTSSSPYCRYRAATTVTATNNNTVLTDVSSDLEWTYTSSSDYSGYYELTASGGNYLYARTATVTSSSTYYNYYLTLFSGASEYTAWNPTTSGGRFRFQNYGIYNNNTTDYTYYLAYDSTNDRFSISSSTSYAYLYAYKKNTTSATFTAPVTLVLTAGTTNNVGHTVTASGTNVTASTYAKVESSNENVVTVNEDYTLNALMPGTACVSVAITSADGTVYMKEITVKVVEEGETAPATTALHALREASLYNSTITTYASSSSSSYTTVTNAHHIDGTPVILYPGNSDTNNVAFVAIDPAMDDTLAWTYSSSGLQNVLTENYMYGISYYNSSGTHYYTIRSCTTTNTNASSTVSYSGSIGTGGALSIGGIYAHYTMTASGNKVYMLGGATASTAPTSENFRIFAESTVTYNPGVVDNAISSVDIFAIRDEDSDRNLITQTYAVYNDVDAGETFSLDYQLVDMPTGYTENSDDCEWELREQSKVYVEGVGYVPVITGFNEEDGTFTVNPLLNGIEWQGYVVVGYVYSFEYDGAIHEVANYGKIYLSSGTYEMDENDLPDFPEPGYVGLDKTAATPYGAFINSGIGKVELTNFGIPSSKPVDVVLILDISGSMDDSITGLNTKKISKAKEAACDFAETLLEGSNNSLSIVTFSNGANVITGDRTATESSFVRKGALNSTKYLINQILANGGTNFDEALKLAYRIMYDNYNTYGTAHNRAVVFMTDGAPGFYNNITLSDKLTTWANAEYSDTIQQQAWDYWCLGSNSSYSMSSYFTTAERYNYSSAGTNMYLDAMKAAAGTTLTSSNFTNSTWVSAITALDGVTTPKGLGTAVYTVGFDIANSDYINAQSNVGLTGTSAAAVMRVNATSASYYHNADADTDLTDVFTTIARAIRLVADNAVTNDTVSEYFDLNVNTGYTYVNSSNETVDGTATGSNVITYGYYDLDENYNVVLDTNGQPVFHIVETVTVTGTNSEDNNYEAAITGATSSIKGSCWSSTAYEDSNARKGQIQAQWFTYDVGTKHFEWHINEGDRMEDKRMYSLSYGVRLLDEYRVDGSAIYPTNEGATLSYNDVNGYPVTQEYPMPELPWSGGQVHYEFYLVNEQGQPIDTAGNVVPFSQRVVVYTGPVDRFHPGAAGTANAASTVEYRASDIINNLGLSYTLYDTDAAYSVTINDDSYNTGVVSLTSNGATYVTGLPDHATPYNVSGTNTYTDGAPVNTYVSFPVVFKLTINPDVIIVDYAVGVNVDVIANDLLPGATSAAPLYAVGTTLPTAGTMSNAYGVTATANLAAGFYSKANGALTVTNAAGNVLGTAAVVTSGSNNVVRFTPTQYMISNPQVVDLYCAVQGNIPSAEGATVTTRQAYMYERLTIVPANVMYYDDTYFETTYNPETGAVGAYVDGSYTMGAGYGTWVKEGALDTSVVQHTSYANDFGKPDVHGYDDTIGNYGVHSFNTAHTVRVQQYNASTFGTGAWPSMSFNFKGTGFEIVMDSETDSGNVVVMVYNAAGQKIRSKIIDSYYGTGDLSQTPVVRLDLETYGTYKVVISAVHNAYYAMMHENDSDKTDTSITIDAIRVFEPIDIDAGTAEANAVKGFYLDNNQAYPEVINIQDIVIDSINLTAYNDIELYDLSGNKVTALEEDGTYVIYSALAGGVLTNNNGTLGVTTLATTAISAVPSNARWAFTASEYESEYLDEGDTFGRYTVKNGSYYLTVNTAAGSVEYGELGLTTTAATEADYMNQWTFDGTRLITGPMQVIQGQLGNATHYRNVYYALSYYTAFKAVTSVAPGEADEATTFNRLIHIDGGSTLDPDVYKTIGPNNEIYILPDSAITFRLTSESEPTGVYVELKSSHNNPVSATMFSSVAPSATLSTEELATSMGMYFSVTNKLTWTKGNAANGEDSRKWYSSPLVIYNATNSESVVSSPEQYIVSVCNIKLTYAAPASSGSDPFTNITARQYGQIVDSLEALEWRTYSPLFDLNVHTAAASNASSNGSGISRFSEAYLTVTTSTDVAGLILTDANGKYVNVKSCTYADNGSTRVWTLTIDRASSQRYNINVNTVSAVYDMRNPVSTKITVPSLVTFVRPGNGLDARPVA